jgi:acetyltransferase-like isoleucine patch superfamily enzyme
MLNKIVMRWKNDGIFFLFSLFGTMKDYLLSKIVSLIIKKRVKMIFPCNVRGLRYISIGNNFVSGSGLWLEALGTYFSQSFSPKITISDHVNLSNNVHIACINSIYIGKGVLIGSNVFIGDHQHGNLLDFEGSVLPKFRSLHSRGPIVIGENTWIGDGVHIFDNVTIGEQSIIGSQSVVTSHIPAYSIAVGIPAKVIKQYVNGTWVKV